MSDTKRKFFLSRKELNFFYKDCAMSYDEISKEIWCKKRTVIRWAKKLGIVSRPLFLARKVSRNVIYKTREESHAWKRGYKFYNGYKYVLVGKNKYRAEHTLIMENKIGRKLNKNEVVHHINENRLDNRIENLQLMTISEHLSHHKKVYWEKQRSKK